MTPHRLASLVIALLSIVPSAAAQSSTSFTYQGELGTTGAPYTGLADLRYRLYDAATGTTQVGSQIDAPNTTVTNGRFTADLDFGSAFDAAQPLWLEIDVRTPAGSGPYTTLSPRQRIAAAPLAQAILDIPLSPRGSQTLDQDQSKNPGLSGIDLSAVAPCWQSFTAGKSGMFDRVDVWSTYATDEQLTVTVRSGFGEGGQALGTTTVSVPSGLVAVALPNIPIAAGSIYTIELSGHVLLESSDVPIPGSRGRCNGTDFNWRFRTFVTPFRGMPITASNAVTAVTSLSSLTANTASAVPWSGVSGVPTNVSGAFSPWSTATNGISYLSSVGVGTATPLSVLHVKSNAGVLNIEGADHAFIQFYPFGFGSGRKAYIGTPSANSIDFTVANQISGGTLNLQGTNVRIVGNFINNSDARDKHDVRAIDNALALVQQLHGVRYLWNDHSLGGEPLPPGQQLGFLAQEVEKVLPQAVATSADGRKGVSYVSIVPLLVEAIKQQQTQLEAALAKRDAVAARLAAENAELKARLDRIERQLNAAAK